MASQPSELDTVFETARRFLETAPVGTPTLERVWSRAGAESVVAGQLIDPPLARLKELTAPDRAWDNQPWPPEHIVDRGRCVADCHLLAIALGDLDWLEQLDGVWEPAPVAYEWHLLARGQIGLGLERGGARSPTSWTEDDIELLLETGELVRDDPAGRAWMALTAGDMSAARAATEAFHAAVDRWTEGWPAARGAELQRVLGAPGRILRVELRALTALVAPR